MPLMHMDDLILRDYLRLREQTGHSHAQDVICQRYGIDRGYLARLVVAEGSRVYAEAQRQNTDPAA